jgi:type IV fimbrial biogenesis protein FimT
VRRLSATGRALRLRGVTLVELMVALAVMAVLVAAAAPFMGDLVVNSRLRESGNVLFTEALVAQSEAIKRNTTVRVSTTGGDTVQVHDMTTPATPVLLRARAMAAGVTVPTTIFSFGPEGRPMPFGTAVSVNLAAVNASCSADLRCPGLRVDAGGATRLCPNHQVSCP